MKKRSRVFAITVRWGLALLILLLLFLAMSQFDIRNLLHSIKQIPLWSVALLLGLQIVSQLLLNLKWHKIAKVVLCEAPQDKCLAKTQTDQQESLRNAPISFRDMFYINSQGAVIEGITPGVKIGGEVTRAVQIRRMGKCSAEQAASVVAMQKLFSLSTFFLINLFAVGHIIGKVPILDAWYVQFSIYSILIFFLLLFAAVFFVPHRLQSYLQPYLQAKKNTRFSFLLKMKRFFITLLGQVISIRKNSRVCVMLFLLSTLIWLIYPVKMYLLAIQVFPALNIVYIGAITFVSYMVGMIPIFPGGLGGFEGTMSGLFLAIGFEQSDAFVITIIFRFATFWFVMMISIIFIVFYKIKYPRAINEKAAKKGIYSNE